jgi:hypothetical protein
MCSHFFAVENDEAKRKREASRHLRRGEIAWCLAVGFASVAAMVGPGPNR